ncbi:MAG: dienelactone hydrolase family protein [Desulfobacterales bacterium]|nr:dienelactone hydrolase family protein [Desulfobacterales bacterium]
MKKKSFGAICLIIIAMFLVGCVSSGSNQFKGISDRPGTELILDGNLYKPEGDGPFPAVILLHRCAGIKKYDYSWASKIKSWGYVAFIVDSFGPRRISNACGAKGSIGYKDRAMDAYSAKSYLSSLPFVNPEKIAVIGWSMGGNGVLQAIDPVMEDLLPPEYRKSAFKAAISFYPYCFNWLDNLSAPLLILAAGRDDWTPVDYCENRLPKKATTHEVELKIYPDAHHCFDCSGMNKIYMGHTLEYNPEATADSTIRVKEFLAKYLRN